MHRHAHLDHPKASVALGLFHDAHSERMELTRRLWVLGSPHTPVCMCPCVYVSVRTHLCACAHVYMCAYARTSTQAHMHTCTHAHMHTCAHAHMDACTHVHMHTCTHVHIYTHAYVHTCICAYAQLFVLHVYGYAHATCAHVCTAFVKEDGVCMPACPCVHMHMYESVCPCLMKKRWRAIR